MSITITLYNNESDNNVVDKTLTEIATIEGNIKENCSIITPSILIDLHTNDRSNTTVKDGSDPSYASVLKKVNYFYIPNFERYYYKTDVTIIRHGLYMLSGKSDPLTSFATDIKNSKGIVKRQENEWNLYLDDGSLRTYNDPWVTTVAFPTSLSGESFILAVAGS